MADPRVVIVGATGAVGAVALEVLAQRNFPMASLRLTASPRSVGKRLAFNGTEIAVEATRPEVFADCDIAFISATDDISRDMGAAARERGCVVVDDSGVWRMDADVPLVVPEINAATVAGHRGILSIPNCATTPVVMVLDALRREARPERVVAATYQSVTGTGAAALTELETQVQASVASAEPPPPAQYPHQIAFNLLPHIGSLKENGYYSEETKMLNEARKILDDPVLQVSATCVRVPVRVCHSAALNIQFDAPVGAARARDALRGYPSIVVVDEPANAGYPMPIDGAGRDEVFVGRIREDTALPNGIALWAVCDNLRKGAATNAVQIAEQVVAQGAWLR